MLAISELQPNPARASCRYFAMLINKAPEDLVTATANYTLDW